MTQIGKLAALQLAGDVACVANRIPGNVSELKHILCEYSELSHAENRSPQSDPVW